MTKTKVKCLEINITKKYKTYHKTVTKCVKKQREDKSYISKRCEKKYNNYKSENGKPDSPQVPFENISHSAENTLLCDVGDSILLNTFHSVDDRVLPLGNDNEEKEFSSPNECQQNEMSDLPEMTLIDDINCSLVQNDSSYLAVFNGNNFSDTFCQVNGSFSKKGFGISTTNVKSSTAIIEKAFISNICAYLSSGEWKQNYLSKYKSMSKYAWLSYIPLKYESLNRYDIWYLKSYLYYDYISLDVNEEIIPRYISVRYKNSLLFSQLNEQFEEVIATKTHKFIVKIFIVHSSNSQNTKVNKESDFKSIQLNMDENAELQCCTEKDFSSNDNIHKNTDWNINESSSNLDSKQINLSIRNQSEQVVEGIAGGGAFDTKSPPIQSNSNVEPFNLNDVVLSIFEECCPDEDGYVSVSDVEKNLLMYASLDQYGLKYLLEELVEELSSVFDKVDYETLFKKFCAWMVEVKKELPEYYHDICFDESPLKTKSSLSACDNIEETANAEKQFGFDIPFDRRSTIAHDRKKALKNQDYDFALPSPIRLPHQRDISDINNESFDRTSVIGEDGPFNFTTGTLETVAGESFLDPIELHQEMLELKHTHIRIKNENKRLNSRWSQSESVLQDLRSENKKLHDELEVVQKQLSILKDREKLQKEELKRQIDCQDELIIQLKHTLNLTQINNDELKEKLEVVSDQLMYSDDQLKCMNQEKDEIIKQVESYSKQVKYLQSELTEKNEAIQCQKIRMKNLEDKIYHLEERETELQQENIYLKSRRNSNSSSSQNSYVVPSNSLALHNVSDLDLQDLPDALSISSTGIVPADKTVSIDQEIRALELSTNILPFCGQNVEEDCPAPEYSSNEISCTEPNNNLYTKASSDNKGNASKDSSSINVTINYSPVCNTTHSSQSSVDFGHLRRTTPNPVSDGDRNTSVTRNLVDEPPSTSFHPSFIEPFIRCDQIDWIYSEFNSFVELDRSFPEISLSNAVKIEDLESSVRYKSSNFSYNILFFIILILVFFVLLSFITKSLIQPDLICRSQCSGIFSSKWLCVKSFGGKPY